ncbi:hypothetical protein [Alkalimarinus alittae]|uniref:DUF4345 domain-containing protein n=1 Tax=Alkalimarinus alittae TaxID=2961619 RepID=A0ABY6N6M8_9ALTE|nr:hypothetical protein [Alkalimarinus alittae]UZE97778.1 hypothetical protein NKI27_08600 [Alkalimarinus alittae]
MTILRVVGCLYMLSGGWCAFAPALAAGFLGFSFTGNSGYAEFFAVYGGLQVGLGSALVMSSLIERYIEGGLYFAAILSTSLLIFRVLGIVYYGSNAELLSMAILEALIAAVLWIGWIKIRRQAELDFCNNC